MKRAPLVIIVLIGLTIIAKLATSHSATPTSTSSTSDSTDSTSLAQLVSPSPSPSASLALTATPTLVAVASAGWKDGTYTGSAERNSYGTVQVAAVISGGKLTGINFIRMPSGEGHTQEVTKDAQPILLREALQTQSATVDVISGATQTSESFTFSLKSALSKAS